MTSSDDAIRRIAALVGIAPGYRNQDGAQIETSLQTVAAVLSGLGLPVGSGADIAETLNRVERTKAGLLPALIPVPVGVPAQIPVRARSAETVTWRLMEESGATREGRTVLAESGHGPVLQIPALPPGYHRFRLELAGRIAEATLIAAPPRCWEQKPVREGARLWGTTAQVYSLRSNRNFGIGDYTDVADAALGSAAFGASFLGLSPVHALFSADRTKISPYSPSSRLFLETLFIDPTALESFGQSAAAALLGTPEAQEQLRMLRDGPLVDHQAAWAFKRPLLDLLWDEFRRVADHTEFERFRRLGGDALQSHATFEALSEHFRNEGRLWTGDWPEEFRRAGTAQVRRFRQEHADEVSFHAWLQWLADCQLSDAAERARTAGMSIGLYRDLAVGADAAGSEVWANPERFAPVLSIGAPPDPLGPQGQNWGLPPFDPLALEEQGLAAFRALVAANMRHAGAIRIDHAFQLQRLFLIPQGLTAADGAYVTYPFEAMLAVLRLESHRSRCLVIAEDLGTAPDSFSDAIMDSGIMSYRVLPFEREWDGSFKRPAAYPKPALAVITTHDLPTFRGWWRGLDIDLRQTLGIYDQETANRERNARQAELHRFAEALAAEGLLPNADLPEDPPIEAAMRYLARTPSALVGLQFEDAAGELNQANLPGLVQGHPNWKRRLGADVEAITAPGSDLAKLAAAITAEGRGTEPRASALAAPPPRATYRLQFHKDFTFDDAIRIVPYLARLGISHLYSSPIHAARPGSMHGYDIVDHSTVNPELGGEAGFVRLTDTLKEHGLGLVLDIVPNHMGVGGSDNSWWLSVLEWGELSPYGRAFDIDWERLGANRNLVIPFLGDRYGEALEKGELKLSFDPEDGRFSVWHWEHCFPISPLSYPIVLDRALAALPEGDTQQGSELLAVSERLRAMEAETAPERRANFPEEAEALRARLAAAVAQSPTLRQAIDRAVALVNGFPGTPESFGTLHRILEAQSYRLAHWRVAASDINYRRFFDINGLAGLRIEDPDVFERSHATIFRLVREGRIQGLRIDHIDGLADPEAYARALQSAVGPGFYIVIEKILEPGEALRPWPVAGTTGYDVLNLLDGVFVESRAASRFESIYRAFTGLEGRYESLLLEAKTEILERSFASELEVLVSDLKRIADANRRTRDYTVLAIRQALIEIIARFPVYRSYLGDGEPTPEDWALIQETVEAAKRMSGLPDRTVHDFAAATLLGGIETGRPGLPDPELVRRFRRRFQQLTGPVMAKSLEDTLFYRYVRLLSLNEVGGDPERFGTPADEFHRANLDRQREWPHAMIATATHDTKRGEDARTRINALSEVPDEWQAALDRWRALASPYLASVEGNDAPDANDLYLILQAVLGAWPIDLLDEGSDRGETVASFRERMEEYLPKALREAKRHTSWVHGNEAYEKAALDLLRGILAPGSEFLSAFRPLAIRLARLGMLASLGRTVLKCTIPGVPDTYQGTELWDLSLVDPDNRRPVDYTQRERLLDDETEPSLLMASWRTGAIKQRVVRTLLADRAASPALYDHGDYQPLRTRGGRARHVFAFVRTSGQERLAVIVPRLLAGFVAGEAPPDPAIWGETNVALSDGRWRDVITGREVVVEGDGLRVSELFREIPISVMRGQS